MNVETLKSLAQTPESGKADELLKEAALVAEGAVEDFANTDKQYMMQKMPNSDVSHSGPKAAQFQNAGPAIVLNGKEKGLTWVDLSAKLKEAKVKRRTERKTQLSAKADGKRQGKENYEDPLVGNLETDLAYDGEKLLEIPIFKNYGEAESAALVEERGGFNEVLRVCEVHGIHRRNQWQIEAFRRVIKDCGLIDLGYSGHPYTFSNRRKGNLETKARLDRVFVNKAWLEAGMEYQVRHLTAIASDHSPIIFCPKASEIRGSDRSFRFEPMWLRHYSFMNVVPDSWKGSRSDSSPWNEKLVRCAAALSSWNKREFGNIKKRIEWLKLELEKVRSLPRTEYNCILEEKISVEMDEWLAREELMWRQRSRVEWLKFGDKNTKFFHARVSQRRKKNCIERLRNKNVSNATGLEQFRPISLCKVIMKIITKSLVNRLQKCLDKVISLNQSAFVKGRIITDNIVLAQEINHFIKCRQKQKEGYASLKLDMSKAFDRLEWSFIEQMMLKLGFARDWVEKIMLCVTSVSYRVKVNNWEIKRKSEEGVLMGISVARGAPKITHLFFADDCMVYLRANVNHFTAIKRVLDNYEAVAGQRVNYAKSEVFFSPNVEAGVGDALSNLLGVAKVNGHSKYLGLPL
ncbi:hypothetical protein QQ045_001471 [Rhodiola kirilowii]